MPLMAFSMSYALFAKRSSFLCSTFCRIILMSEMGRWNMMRLILSSWHAMRSRGRWACLRDRYARGADRWLGHGDDSRTGSGYVVFRCVKRWTLMAVMRQY